VAGVRSTLQGADPGETLTARSLNFWVKTCDHFFASATDLRQAKIQLSTLPLGDGVPPLVLIGITQGLSRFRILRLLDSLEEISTQFAI
jgi:hypothetical protein